MDINATLLGQMITFALFVWFTMTYVWPHITEALEERRDKIADGLAAAERGQKELELAQEKVTSQLRDVKKQSSEIIDQANKRANNLVDDAKVKAREEGEKLIVRANAEIAQQTTAAKTALGSQVATLAVAGAERILGKEIDSKAHQALLDELIKQI